MERFWSEKCGIVLGTNIGTIAFNLELNILLDEQINRMSTHGWI